MKRLFLYMGRKRGRKKRKRVKHMVLRRSMINTYRSPHHFILRNAVDLNTNSSGTIIGVVNCNSLTNAYIQSDTVTTQPLLEVADLKNLFDQYRVNAIRLKYVPSINTYQTIVAGTGGPANFAGRMAHVALTYDVDNVGQPGNFSELLTRDKVKVLNIAKKWTHMQKIQKTIQRNQDQGTSGFLNLQSEATNTAGVIWIRGDRAMTLGSGGADPLNVVPVGYLLIEYYVTFKRRQ